MAKQIDTSKIERIQEAAVEIVSMNGVAGASVAAIAQRAGVSVGYLYRHYQSKEELISDMLDHTIDRISNRIELLLEEKQGTEEIIRKFLGYMLNIAITTPLRIKFIIMLQNDFSYNVDRRIIEHLQAQCERIMQQGISHGSIKPQLTIEDFYIALVCVPLQYLNARFRMFFSTTPPDQDLVEKLTQICTSLITQKK